MRKRTEITQDFNNFFEKHSEGEQNIHGQNLWKYKKIETERNERFQFLVLEVLLDIRDLLVPQAELSEAQKDARAEFILSLSKNQSDLRK